MIKRPSRKLIYSSLRSDLPLCVNTYDYAYSGPTDPSVPLPSSVGVTLNAPVKVTFPSFGTSGFTASGNSFGVSAAYPTVPFQVSNPTRYKVQGLNSGTGNVISVTRVSDSPATVFERTGFPGSQSELISKFYSSGFYNRSDYDYLFSTYATVLVKGDNIRTLVLVYSPLKFLPRSFGMTGLAFYTRDPGEGQDRFETALSGKFDIVSVTSPTIVDTSNGSVQLGCWGGNISGDIDYGAAFIMGTTTFAFDL